AEGVDRGRDAPPLFHSARLPHHRTAVPPYVHTSIRLPPRMVLRGSRDRCCSAGHVPQGGLQAPVPTVASVAGVVSGVAGCAWNVETITSETPRVTRNVPNQRSGGTASCRIRCASETLRM